MTSKQPTSGRKGTRKPPPKQVVHNEQPKTNGSTPSPAAKKGLNFSSTILALSKFKRSKAPTMDMLTTRNPFALPQAPPWVPREYHMAMDQNINDISSWAGDLWNTLGSVASEGTAWLGYAYLSELAQRAEYRRISETLANPARRAPRVP